MTKKDIIDAWAVIRKIDNSIPDDVLDFMKDCAIEKLDSPPMYFSKVYVQKNFVPDIVTDQFGREVIGTEVTIERSGSIENAEQLAKQYVKEYIQKNTVYPDHNHIEIRNVNEPLPEIQVENVSLEDLVSACEDYTQLYQYAYLSKMKGKAPDLYRAKLIELDNKIPQVEGSM